jgi:hypothetical protein
MSLIQDSWFQKVVIWKPIFLLLTTERVEETWNFLAGAKKKIRPKKKITKLRYRFF